MINYWSRLINGKHKKLAFILYRKMRASDGMHSNWVLKIQRILEECGRPDLWLNQSCNHYCSKMIKSVFANLEYKIRKFFKRSQLQIVQGFDKFRIIFYQITRIFVYTSREAKNRQSPISM